jgi:glycosyltransferase involved in cell wall biosynthesis
MRKAESPRRWCCWVRETGAEQRLRQLAQQLQVADRVLFKGFQKNPLPWIKHARMLVLSSDSEGFGNVVVEALLLDTPVASTRCPGG